MSVTIQDMLKLPCFNEAELIAGKNGLKKIITGISVLEYASPVLLKDLIASNIDFFRSEIVITGFMNVPKDVDTQRDCISRLIEGGEAGVILYYVGIFMPFVDQRLIDIANEKDFPLICMPKNCIHFRYSEAITDVMELVLRNQMNEEYFVGEILERMARMPLHQRSIDTVMKMLSVRISAALMLTNERFELLNAVSWTHNNCLELTDIQALNCGHSDETKLIMHEGKEKWLSSLNVVADNNDTYKVIIVNIGDKIAPAICKQVQEIISLSINMWNENHGNLYMSEMVHAILKDEPMKVRKIGALYNINVALINYMWVITAKNSAHLLILRKDVQTYLSGKCDIVVSDIYEYSVVAFFSKPYHNKNSVSFADEFIAEQEAKKIDIIIKTVPFVRTTTEVRDAYLIMKQVHDVVETIFPQRKVYTLGDVNFAKQCIDIINAGESAINEKILFIEPLLLETNDVPLAETLTRYLLDENCNLVNTGKSLYVHKNTIRYRLVQIDEKLNHPVMKTPELFEIYYAVAIKRILDNS